MVLQEIAYTMVASLALAAALAVAPALSADDAGQPSSRGPVLADRTVEDLYPGCVRAPADTTQQGLSQPERQKMQSRKPEAYKMDCPPGYMPGPPPARTPKGPGGG